MTDNRSPAFRALRMRMEPAWRLIDRSQSLLSHSPEARVGIYALLFFLLLFARRHQQLLAPEVWDEDGTQILPQLINNGPLALFWSANGYLVLVPRMISFLALSISFVQYPLVSTLIAWAFTITVLVAISVAPIALRGGPLLGLVVLLIPSDPEVFGLPLYTLWWAALLVVTAAFWNFGTGRAGWRLAFVVFGGLSSPIIVLVLPLFLYRAVVRRNDRSEWIIAATSAACAFVQVRSLMTSQLPPGGNDFSASSLLLALPTFLGNYIAGVLRGDGTVVTVVTWLAAVATLALVIATIVQGRGRRSVMIGLVYLLCGSIFLVAARVTLSALNPETAGPRYFFFPFVIEGWLLLQICFTATSVALRSIATLFLMCAAAGALPTLSRSQDRLFWQANVEKCAAVADTESYNLPVEFDGSTVRAYALSLTGGQCRNLIARDLLAGNARRFVARPVENR